MSDFTFTFHFHALEKEMATHSSVLAWRIPGRSLVGCRLWGRTESDTTEVTQQQQQQQDRGRRRFHRKGMAYSRSHKQQAAHQGLNSCLFRPKPTSHTALKIRKQAEFPSLFLALMVHMPGE